MAGLDGQGFGGFRVFGVAVFSAWEFRLEGQGLKVLRAVEAERK